MEDEQRIILHKRQEIARLCCEEDPELILNIYRNLAKYWWWDGLIIHAEITQDPKKNTRYYLHQTELSEEYDPIKYPQKPYKLGYLEITKSNEESNKLLDLLLVCSWQVVVGFWKELDITFRDLASAHDIGTPIERIRKNKIYIPTRSADRAKWKKVWDLIKSTYIKSPGGYKLLTARITNIDPSLPHSRETVALICKAGMAGLLDD